MITLCRNDSTSTTTLSRLADLQKRSSDKLIDVSRIHWDMTSFSVYGEYEQVDEAYAVPKFGHPKDRRPDLKQVQAGIAVAADGAVPIFGRAYDGGAGEVAQVIPMMKKLQEIATSRRLLIVGDTKLVSYDNLATMHADTGGQFVGRSHLARAQLFEPGMGVGYGSEQRWIGLRRRAALIVDHQAQFKPTSL